MTGRTSKAFIEVDITFHPEALREALSLRNGAFGRLLRMLSLCLFAYLAIGLQIAMPRYFPELRCNPAPLLVAYCAVRSRGALLPAVLSVAVGLLLESSFGCPLGALAIPLVGIAAALNLASHEVVGRRWRWHPLGGWTTAALCGAFADGLYAFWTTLFLSAGIPWRQRLLLCATDALPGMLLAAVAYAPIAFAIADCLLQPVAPRASAKE